MRNHEQTFTNMDANMTKNQKEIQNQFEEATTDRTALKKEIRDLLYNLEALEPITKLNQTVEQLAKRIKVNETT